MTVQSRGDDRVASRKGVERAAAKMAAILPPTPLLPLEVDGITLWCKAECLQPIGAFKIRGGWHRLTDLDSAQRAAGVVAFSSGNHAQGVAWSAKRLGMSATIVMPADAPAAKLQATLALGAEVVTFDRLTEDRIALAAAIAEKRGAVLVPSYDDPWVIEGQGSAAIEIAGQLATRGEGPPTHLVIPCGGGGLSSGCALALPDARISIVEPEGWADMGESLRRGVIVPVGPTRPPPVATRYRRCGLPNAPSRSCVSGTPPPIG